MHLPLRSVSWSNLQRAGRRATAELCGWCGQSLLGWWRASPGRCVQGGTQQSGACGRRTEWNGGRSEPVAIREHVILLAKWRWKGSTWSTVDLRDLQWIYMIYSGSAWSTVDLRDLQWIYMIYSGSAWSTVDLRDLQWMYVIYSGSTRSTVDLHDLQWIYVIYSGSTWSTVDLRDLQWIYMIYSGSVWSTVDLNYL